MKKRLLSILLVVAMLTGCLGGLCITASAAAQPYGDFVVETDVENGCSFNNGVLTVQAGGTYTVSMAEGVTETANTIVINAADVVLKLDDVQIASEKQGTAALTLNYDATLEAVGEVRLTGYTNDYGDLSAGISGTGKTLTFTGGTLYATGGSGMMTGSYYDAESGYCGVAANVVMTGGTLYATGGNGSEQRSTFAGRPGGAGIIGNVTLHDGTMYATGGNGGDSRSDAGDGMMGISGTVTVNGGALYVKGGNGGSDTGGSGGHGGAGIYGNLNLYGGRVEVTGGNGGDGSSYSGDGMGRGEGGNGVSAVFPSSSTMSDGRVLVDRGTLISTAGEPGAGRATSLYGKYIYRYNRAFSIAPTVAADRQTTILVGASASNCWSASTYSNQKYTSYVAKICYPIHYEQVEEDFYGPTRLVEDGQAVIPNPAKADHHFDGWQINGVGEPVKDLVLDGALYTDAITLTAVWTEKETYPLVPEAQKYVYDTNAQAYVLPADLADGVSVEYFVDGAWTVQPPVNAGAYNVKLTRAEDETYKRFSQTLTGGLVIEQATPVVTPPTVKTGLYYNGEAQELITAGTTSGGTLLYSVNDGAWSEAIPTGTEAGTYQVSYYVQGDANYKGLGARALPAVEIRPPVTACDRGVTCPIHGFGDAAPDAWYHDGVHYCLENGMMNGTSATTFAPGATTSRAMLVTMLWRLEGEPAAQKNAGFTDVPANTWYTRAVDWAAETGVVKGIGDGTFRPDQVLTREQAVVMLHRYAALKGCDMTASATLDHFRDSGAISGFAVDAMEWACAEGLIYGKTGSILDPGGNTTRAEMATMLMRFCQKILN